MIMDHYRIYLTMIHHPDYFIGEVKHTSHSYRTFPFQAFHPHTGERLEEQLGASLDLRRTHWPSKIETWQDLFLFLHDASSNRGPLRT